MPTPSYQGPNQPIADNGGSWLGRLGSFFGGAAPSYASAPPKPTVSASSDPPELVELPACPIDPASLPPDGIVVVVPRRSGT